MFDARPQHNKYLRPRAQQFRQQVERRLDGSLTEDEFRPLRLMNGVYLQLHAYMLRVAIPYGTLNPDQMRQLAMIAERWDCSREAMEAYAGLQPVFASLYGALAPAFRQLRRLDPGSG